MKFGQLIEHPRGIFFFENYAENEAEKPVPGRFLFFKKALYKLKQVVCTLISLYFDSPQISIQ